MGNIGNKNLYPNETVVNRTDSVIGTNQDGLTKTFQLDDLQSLLDADGYTRAQIQTLISNSDLKVNVNYKITDAGAGDETIIVRAASTNTLFTICYNISNTAELFAYDIATDTLAKYNSNDPNAVETLTNKTITDYTNKVHADAVHHRAKATENILKGQPVVITGYNAVEDAYEVELAINTTGVATGIAEEDISIGNFGMIVSAGSILGLNTSAFSEGAILWVDGAGVLTATRPTTGFEQPIAYVLRSHAVNGALQVLAYYPLQDAEDVRIDSISGMTSANVQTALAELNTLRSATLTTGGTVKFDKTYIHNSPLSPLTGDITFDATGAVEGSSAIICHQQTTAPSINTGGLTISKTIGSYVESDPAQYNEIVLTYIGNGYVTVTYRANVTSVAFEQTDSITGFWDAPTEKTYTLMLKAPYAGTITETTSKCVSGTCTATFSINGTPLGGTANSVSSAEQSQAHASANTFVAGDDIAVTVSSNSSCADMALSVKFTYNLA